MTSAARVYWLAADASDVAKHGAPAIACTIGGSPDAGQRLSRNVYILGAAEAILATVGPDMPAPLRQRLAAVRVAALADGAVTGPAEEWARVFNLVSQ